MKKKAALFFLLELFFLFIVNSALGSGLDNRTEKPRRRVPEINSKVRVDGILNEKAWQEALVLELNYEVEPGENIKPPVKTEVFLACSTNHLYVAFRAYDSDVSGIRARLTDRDNIWNDDYVGIVLDTFNDSRRTYNFYCNPFGVQAERIESMVDGSHEWDAIWNSAGRINKNGYIVEMAISFSSLRFQRKKEDQVWGIDAIRSYPRSLNHLIGLYPRDRDNNCYMCQADKIIGFEGAKPGKNIELDPSLSTVVTQERKSFPAGEFDYKTRSVDPGLTARWNFTPNLTLNAAINPDFSNVEADVAQLDINTQFTLYYPERRPFFLEDANLFRLSYIVIHTRTLADPNWGVKLTGKEGANALGFFLVQDNITNLLFPGNQGSRATSLNMKTIGTALRYRRDVGKSSNLGIVITDREGDNYYNRVAGIDGNILITKRDRIVFLALTSWTQYPEQVALKYDQPADDLKGNAWFLYYAHDTEKLGWYLKYEEITSGFRADIGFITQEDYKNFRGTVRYTFRRNPGHWYTRLNFTGTYHQELDHHNNLLHKGFGLLFDFEGPALSFLNLTVNFTERSFMGVLFDEDYISFNSGIRPSGSLSLMLSGVFGDRIDYLHVRAGQIMRVNPGIQYNLGRHLYLSFNHVFEKLTVDGGRLYSANLSNLRMVYQFNRRVFMRAILQYANYDYNTSLYSITIDPLSRHLFSQFLFSYKINPRTVLFLGYSDDYFGYNYMPSLKQNNRTFFFKIGYALVL
jgi:hypothetical protein